MKYEQLISQNTIQSTNFSEYYPAGDYPVGNILRIEFRPEVRAAFREIFINYRSILC